MCTELAKHKSDLWIHVGQYLKAAKQLQLPLLDNDAHFTLPLTRANFRFISAVYFCSLENIDSESSATHLQQI